MDLIRMLAKARSLMGVGEGPARYEVVSDQGRWVPQFHRSGQGPGTGSEEPEKAGPGRGRERGNEEKAGEADSRQAELNMKTEEKPGGMSGGLRAGEMSGGTRGRWLGRSLGPRPILRADSKGQLSLEFVKVVRNDLSDSDLELVPSRTVKRAGWASPAPVPSQAVRGEAGGIESASGLGTGSGAVVGAIEPEASRWSRFRSKIFGVSNPG